MASGCARHDAAGHIVVLQRWTLFILRHRWAVLGLWLLALALTLLASIRLASLLTNHFQLPGTDSERAESILEAQFGQRTVGEFTLIVKTLGPAESIEPWVTEAVQRAADALPTGSVGGVFVVSEHVVVARIVSLLTSAQAKAHTPSMRAAIGSVDGARTYLTGFAAVEFDLDPILRADLWKGEVLVALPVAVVLLMWTFGTLSFLLPLVFAIFTIPVTLGLVFLFAQVMELTTYITNLVGLVGLGIAIDYSLLMVHRFREQVACGGSQEQAVVRTMDTAGRAVVFSGTAVGIGLALLLFLPLPFLRGFGVGGLLIPLVSVLGATTLMPVLLLLGGVWLDRAHLLPRRLLDRRAQSEQGFWPHLAHAVMRRPLVVATATTAALLLMAAPMLQIELGPGSRADLPRGLESIEALDIVTAAIGAGATAPTQILVDTGRAGGAATPDVTAAAERLVQRLRADPQVAKVYFAAELPQFIDLSGRYLKLQIVGLQDFGTPESVSFVDRLRRVHVPAAAFPAPAMVFAGGAPPAGRDFLGLVSEWFPRLMVAILAATYLLLMRAFRSLLLPLKAIVLNLLSIGAAYGLTVAAFSWGWGSPFGLIAHSQLNAWIPVMVFAMLFGLSMDYEVFLVCRMRERWDLGDSNEDAVASGLAATGRLVSSAGLIMCAAFGGFVAGSIVELQQFGFALAASVLVDVSIVRALLLPAAMKLFGNWNWYLPNWAASLLRVPASPLRERQTLRGRMQHGATANDLSRPSALGRQIEDGENR